MITARRKTSQAFFFFYLLKIFLEKLYFLFENMCLKFGKDVIFVSAGIFLGWFCFGFVLLVWGFFNVGRAIL